MQNVSIWRVTEWLRPGLAGPALVGEESSHGVVLVIVQALGDEVDITLVDGRHRHCLIGEQPHRAARTPAVGDAEWRWYCGNGRKGWGLRSGTCSYAGSASSTRITLRKVRWTSDTTVSGPRELGNR
jgi:hypothetical protein